MTVPFALSRAMGIAVRKVEDPLRMILSPQTFLRGERNEEGAGDRMGVSRCMSLGPGSVISFTTFPSGSLGDGALRLVPNLHNSGQEPAAPS